MAFKAFMFLYRSISFFNYIIEPNFDLNIELVSGFMSAMDSLATGIYGTNIQSINLGKDSIFSLDVPLTSKPEENFKIVSFTDKSLPELEITKKIQKIRDAFFDHYSPQDVVDWDGNVLKFLSFQHIIDQILEVHLSNVSHLPHVELSEKSLEFQEGLLFLLCNSNFKPLVQYNSHPNQIFSDYIIENLTYEMQKSTKNIFDLVLPLLDQHQIVFIRCQKTTTEAYLMQYHEKDALYGVICYLINDKYQGFLPKIISLAQSWSNDKLKQMWHSFFDIEKFIEESLDFIHNPFSIIDALKFETKTTFNPRVISQLKNHDQLISALITDEPIAIIGSAESTKELLHQLVFFTQHRQIRIIEYPPMDIPKESVDIVVISPKESKYYRDFIQVDIEKKIVKGGKSNKFCEKLLNILCVIPDSSMASQALHKKLNWLMSKATLIRNLSWGTHITNHEISAIRGDIDADSEKIILKLAGGYNSQLQDFLDRVVDQVPLKNLLIDENFVKFNDRKILVNGKLSPDKRIIYFELLKKLTTLLLGPKVINSLLV